MDTITEDQFRRLDTKRPPGVYVRFERELETDQFPPAKLGEYMGQGDESDEHRAETNARIDAYYRDEWWFVGVRAVAHIQHVYAGGSSTLYTIKSAGLWSVESDSSESHLAEIFDEQKSELAEFLNAIGPNWKEEA